MLAVWRVQAMDKAIAAAWRKGVVLCGISAGGMCWFEAGITDSFGSRLTALRDGLGFLKGAFCPHYDGEPERRPTLHRELRRGFPPTVAADDGVGLHFVGTRLVEAVSSRPQARAYRVRLVDGKAIEGRYPRGTLDSNFRHGPYSRYGKRPDSLIADLNADEVSRDVARKSAKRSRFGRARRGSDPRSRAVAEEQTRTEPSIRASQQRDRHGENKNRAEQVPP
jgi:Peptidase family S51